MWDIQKQDRESTDFCSLTGYSRTLNRELSGQWVISNSTLITLITFLMSLAIQLLTPVVCFRCLPYHAVTSSIKTTTTAHYIYSFARHTYPTWRHHIPPVYCISITAYHVSDNRGGTTWMPRNGSTNMQPVDHQSRWRFPNES